MPVQKVCVVCGNRFLVPPCRVDTASTCSNTCAIVVRAKSRERKATVICRGCGKSFEIPRSRVVRKPYCSDYCSKKSVAAKKAMSDRVAGDKNPMWKGGITTHSGGYLYQSAPFHPYASNGYVFKHRLVMEKMLNELCPDSKFLVKIGNNLYLSPEAVVHHIDENRKNNRRRNLIVCTNSTHAYLHQGTEPQRDDYWPSTIKLKKYTRKKKEQLNKT